MKKIALIIFTGSLILGFLSCTPESVSSNVDELEYSTGGDEDDGNLPPPPGT